MDDVDEWELATRKDRFIARLVGFGANAVYRDIEVHHVSTTEGDEPRLSVANHFGGFSDGLVLLHAMPRRPGIVARDVIWRIPVAGRIMTWIGGIPVHQPDSDETETSANDQMFGACYEALAEGRHLLIFPEGLTRNEPSIGRVKTGAARVVLGARAAGVDGVSIAPVGIHYEDKAALRSRVVVIFDESIDLDRVAPELATQGEPVSADNRDAVVDLTSRIDERLRRAAPDFEDWAEARALTSAAEITVRHYLDDSQQPVPIGLRDRLANVLSDRPADHRRRITDAVDVYRRDLDQIGLADPDVHRVVTGRGLVTKLSVQLLVSLVLLPTAIVGALINLIPFLIVKLVGAIPVSASVQASLKPVAAFASFGAGWGIVVWGAGSRFGVVGVAAAIVLLPLYLAAVILVSDRLLLSWRLVRRWRAGGAGARPRARLDAERRAVVQAVVGS